MDERITYDEDFYGWSRQQAAVLRRMAGRPDLPNDLDLEHVAEEIEDVGSAQRSSVQSYIRLIFVHLLKAASVSRPELRMKWFGEIANFHGDLLPRYSNSMRQDIDAALLWRRAFNAANQDLLISADSKCPLELDDFLGEEFDFEAALARIEALIPSQD